MRCLESRLQAEEEAKMGLSPLTRVSTLMPYHSANVSHLQTALLPKFPRSLQYTSIASLSPPYSPRLTGRAANAPPKHESKGFGDFWLWPSLAGVQNTTKACNCVSIHELLPVNNVSRVGVGTPRFSTKTTLVDRPRVTHRTVLCHIA